MDQSGPCTYPGSSLNHGSSGSRGDRSSGNPFSNLFEWKMDRHILYISLYFYIPKYPEMMCWMDEGDNGKRVLKKGRWKSMTILASWQNLPNLAEPNISPGGSGRVNCTASLSRWFQKNFLFAGISWQTGRVKNNLPKPTGWGGQLHPPKWWSNFHRYPLELWLYPHRGCGAAEQSCLAAGKLWGNLYVLCPVNVVLTSGERLEINNPHLCSLSSCASSPFQPHAPPVFGAPEYITMWSSPKVPFSGVPAWLW